jgi:hypothetical protein
MSEKDIAPQSLLGYSEGATEVHKSCPEPIIKNTVRWLELWYGNSHIWHQ